MAVDTWHLLVRVRDLTDREAWASFVQIYAPVVYRYVRRRGLQDADAADVTQEILRRVAAAMQEFRYDRQRGSFAVGCSPSRATPCRTSWRAPNDARRRWHVCSAGNRASNG